MNTMATTASEAATLAGILRAVMSALVAGEIERATSYFGDQFIFTDYGMGLDFHDKAHLAEYFRKERELYADLKRLPDAIFVADNHAISQWTLRATVKESWFGGLNRQVPICIHGTSVVQIENDVIVAWFDYYDSLLARRTPLAAHFTEWIEP